MSDIDDLKHIKRIMLSIANLLVYSLNGDNRDYGFSLIVFPRDDQKMVTYVSDSSKNDMIEIMEEAIEQLKNRQDKPEDKGSIN